MPQENQTLYLLRGIAGIILMLVGILCFICTLMVMGALGKTWYAVPLIILCFGTGMVVSTVGAAIHPDLT